MPKCASPRSRTRSRSTRFCRCRTGCRSSRPWSMTSSAGLRDYDHSQASRHGGRHRRRPQGAWRTMPTLGCVARREIAAGKGSDTSIILYTSGTTGQSKGVVLSAERCIGASSDTVDLRQTDREGRGAGLSAARLGRRPLSQLRAGPGRGLLHGLPGKPRHRDGGPARDRADLLLRAAAHVRADADPRHDPHGGRGLPQAPACSTISSAWRGATARKSSTASRCRCTAGCSYWLGNILVYAPLKNVLGLLAACASPTPPARRSGRTCSRSIARSA